MSRTCAAVLVVLLCVGGPLAQAPDDAVGDVERLFREAQRYHLGADNRPRNPRKAVELYWKVVQQDPRHADAYYNLASLCFEQQRYDLARKYYARTIALLPTDGHARNNLGVVYESQGNLRKSEQLYRKAIQIDPDVAMGPLQPGAASASTGQNRGGARRGGTGPASGARESDLCEPARADQGGNGKDFRHAGGPGCMGFHRRDGRVHRLDAQEGKALVL